MLERIVYGLTFTAAIGSGLVAGIFFAFSTFVMSALGRLPPPTGIAAMQSINITVINPVFMLAFLGTGLVCLALAAGSYPWWGDMNGRLILAASAIYVIGCIGVTMIYNVPLNDALAPLAPDTAQATEFWSRYLRDWTFWNHVRTIAPLVSAILFITALMPVLGPA